MSGRRKNRKSRRKRLIRLIIVLLILVVAAAAVIVMTVKGIGPFDKSSVLELKGDSQMTLKLGDIYEEPGFTASDYRGRDISDKVEVETPEMRNGGEYKVKYTLEDRGEAITAERTVSITYDKPDPKSSTYKHGLPIIMYHDVYDANHKTGEENANYISKQELEKQLKYLVDEGFYFPTWEEVRRYVDGEIELPVKSVVLTFDDCNKGFRNYGLPLLEKYDVRATSFVICVTKGKYFPGLAEKYKHTTFQSHSYNMHRPGGDIGHGGIFPALSHDEGLKDLKKSIDILGSGEAFAYPFGDTTDACEKTVQDAGFKCAVTTVNAQVYPGDDPYLLSRVRLNGDINMAGFKALVKSRSFE